MALPSDKLPDAPLSQLDEEAFYYADRYGYLPEFIEEEAIEEPALYEPFEESILREAQEDDRKDRERTPNEILKKYWGFDDFRPKQLEIIESVLGGNDTLGLLPTGGGKSITFQVPGLILPGVTIVITPLIALMNDQVEHLKRRGIRAEAIHSGLSYREMQRTLENAVHGAYKFLYLSPERITSPAFCSAIPHLKIGMIVVDECHCISQWGYDFRPSYLQIIDFRKQFPKAPILALTATATPEVVVDIMRVLQFARPNVISRSFLRPNLSYVVRKTEDKVQMILQILHSVPGSAIIYCRNRERTRDLAKMLRENDITADFFHAGLTHAERNERQTRWMEDSVRVMVATNAFGMGIDKPNVRVVIHWMCPSSLEEYFQEAGRAGRDGQKAYAVALVTDKDRSTIQRRLSDEFPSKEYIRKVYDTITSGLFIGMGEGFERSYSFVPEEFIQQKHLHPIQTMSAIRILEIAGVWSFIQKEDQKSRLIFTVSREDLYDTPTLSPASDELIRLLLRSYPGIFTDYVFIDEDTLSRHLHCTLEELYLSLLSLSHRRIVHYIPKSSKPKLWFHTRREEGEYIIIPRTAYEERRHQLEQRIKATINYLFNDSICRSAALLAYLGEHLETNCGVCDVCLKKKKAKPSDNIERELIAYLEQTLPHKGNEIAISDLLPHFHYPKEQVVQTLRKIVDQREHFSFDGAAIYRT